METFPEAVARTDRWKPAAMASALLFVALVVVHAITGSNHVLLWLLMGLSAFTAAGLTR